MDTVEQQDLDIKMEEELIQENDYLMDEITKLNGGIKPQLDSFGYFSLFRDEKGCGLSIQAISKRNHLYYPTIVGSHGYLISHQHLITMLRPRSVTLTPQQFYDWYKALKTIFSEI